MPSLPPGRFLANFPTSSPDPPATRSRVLMVGWVNPHAWGEPASANPALHLRRLDGGQVAAHYTDSFERVWQTAKPWHGEDA
jgi:hypothetical protein